MNDLALISRAAELLSKARSILDLGEVRDKARALEEYLRRREGAEGAARDATVIRLRAERRIGQMLAADTGVKRGGSKRRGSALKKLGVGPDDSRRWQRMAQLPDDRFEKILNAPALPTTAAVLAAVMACQAAKSGTAGASELVLGTDIVDAMQQLIRDGRTFGTIYADPPWPYRNRTSRGAACRHYRTMSIEDICDLPVAKVAAAKAHVHLWTPVPLRRETLDVMVAWGFEHRCEFVWAKPQIGLGNYWRVSHEILLLGVRGNLPFADRTLRSWAEYARGRHSEKPDEVRSLIERASPGPYLELFGRKPVEGWTVLGDEVRPAKGQQPSRRGLVEAEEWMEVDL
jgi:N6-adenosine-specific RNA methylase IME4